MKLRFKASTPNLIGPYVPVTNRTLLVYGYGPGRHAIFRVKVANLLRAASLTPSEFQDFKNGFVPSIQGSYLELLFDEAAAHNPELLRALEPNNTEHNTILEIPSRGVTMSVGNNAREQAKFKKKKYYQPQQLAG